MAAHRQKCLAVNPNEFSSNLAIGGSGGDQFSCIGEGAVYLQEIEFFLQTDRIQAIELKLSDGKLERFGRPLHSRDHKFVAKFNFSRKEVFKKITLSPSRSPAYDNPLLGGVVIDMESGRHIEAVVEKKDALLGEIEFPVGSGFCAGIFGRKGWEIDALGFAMRNINSMKLAG